jgi:hypothetical protein
MSDAQEKKTRTRLTEEQRIEKTRAGWEKKLGEKEAEIARLSGEVALLKKALGRAE